MAPQTHKAIKEWTPLVIMILTAAFTVGYFKATYDEMHKSQDKTDERMNNVEQRVTANESDIRLLNYSVFKKQ